MFQKFNQFNIVFGDRLPSHKFPSGCKLKSKLVVCIFPSVSLISVDVSQIFSRSCYATRKRGLSIVSVDASLICYQLWRNMPLKLPRKRVRFRVESTSVPPQSSINDEVLV